MEMLNSLGINSTAAIQFVIFLFTFYFLRTYVFSAYYQAYEKRQEKTKGGEELASEYSEKTAQLHAKYQEESRKIHNEISAIYQKNRGEAMSEYEKTISEARAEAQKLVESTRTSISKAIATAAAGLKGQTGDLALAITNKLLGK
jgi:F-type H+-transporting ATPase subunit b